MKIRCPSTIDHPREFLFHIETDLTKSMSLTKSTILDTYQRNKINSNSKSPNKSPLSISMRLKSDLLPTTINHLNHDSILHKRDINTHLYPDRISNKTPSPKKLTTSLSPTLVKVKGLRKDFNENIFKRDCQKQGLQIAYCRQNFNKINHQLDGTGELLFTEVSNPSTARNKLKKFGLEVDNDVINHGLKHIISERYAKIQMTDRHIAKQHNYFRA